MESVGFADPVDVAGHSRSSARHRRRPRCRAHPRKSETDGYPDGRYYDPATSQFLSVDPLVDVTQQPYGYANENPANESDPTGMWSLNPISDVTQAVNETGSILNRVGPVGEGIWRLTVDVPQDALYLGYWGAYESAAQLDNLGCTLGHAACVGAHLVAIPFVPLEAAGLAGDVGCNALKGERLGQGDVPDTPLLGNETIPGTDFGGRQLTQWLGLPFLSFPGYDYNGGVQFAW